LSGPSCGQGGRAGAFVRLVIAIAILIAVAPLRAGEVARGELAILGLGLEVDRTPVAAATGIPSFVQTVFGGKTNDEAPVIAGLAALGELTGPGIDVPITLSAVPGKKFAIPALHTAGEYTLQNIRLVGAGGEFLQSAVPSFATIGVTDALKTQVRVRQLTPEEMRERGILLDARNYEVYEYTFIFAVDNQNVEVPYSVIVDKQRNQTVPFGQGAQSPPPLPRNGMRVRFSPPPRKEFNLGIPEGEIPPEATEKKIKEPRFLPGRIPAALVMPTGFGVLHQFFAVILEVSNATEDNSTVELDAITASLHAPLQMRLAKVLPAVSLGQPVPIRDEKTGATFLVAGARGTAEWTLEALKTGTHTVDIDVKATYRKPGQDPYPMSGRVSTSIVVSDPRFQINFSHPDTVRKDEVYTAYAFVTNLSEQRQHVALDTSQVPNCSAGLAFQNICRTEGDGLFELDLEPGEMEPVPYKLLSRVTGHVFAAAGSANDETLGVSVQLTMGVSESGIPLSPATLLMPYYTQFLPGHFVDANLQLLGLGYSLAVAPLNKMTAAHPRVITTDVFTRAQEIARAGQRIFIARQQRDVDVAAEDREAMTHLTLDLLDNVEQVTLLPRLPLLEEWDQLRRREEAGRRSAVSVARELERTARGTPRQFIDDFAETTSHRAPFLLAYAHGAGVSGLSVTGRTTGAMIDVPAEAASGWVRTLPTGEVNELTIDGEAGRLAMVGRWSESYRVTIRPSTAAFTIHLLYPDTADGAMLRADLEITGATPNTPVSLDVHRGVRTIAVQNATATVSIVEVGQTPLRVIGAAQDLHLDHNGHVVSLLFNRPVTIADGEKWRNKLALTINVPKANYTATRRNDAADDFAELQIPSAIPQDDGRILNVTFDKVLSRNATYAIAVDGVLDVLAGGAAFSTGGVVPRVDNDRPGAILTGKVLLADNRPVSGAFVTLLVPSPPGRLALNSFSDIIQADVVGADGRFMFEFVPRDASLELFGAYELAARAPDGKTTGLNGAVRLPGEVHTVNLVFHGRGLARGQVRYHDGAPIPNRRLTATSPVFGEEFSAITGSDGRYEMEVGVGPLTFHVQDPEGRVAFASNNLRVAGEIIEQDMVVLRNGPPPGVGTVRVTVLRPDTNEPLANTLVMASLNGFGFGGGYTDTAGRITMPNIPAGLVTLSALHSIAAGGVEIELRPDQLYEQTIYLHVAELVETATIEGVVVRDDPAAPNDRSRDTPVPHAVITIRDYARVTANADGTFSFDHVPLALTGRKVTVFDPATGRQFGTVVPSLIANTVARLPVRFDSLIAPSATMRVRLFDAKGAPVSDHRVFSPGYPPVRLRNIAPGVFEATGVPVPYVQGLIAAPFGNGPYGDQFAKITARVDYDGQVSVTDMRLPGQGTVTVRIVVEQPCGTPPCYANALGRASVGYLVWDDVEQGFRQKTVTADPDPVTGIVTFPNIPARQELFVSTSGHPLGYASDTAFLAFDGDVRAITLPLKDIGDVTGRVFAIDGLTPVSSATVRIITGQLEYSAKITGPDGSFNFPAIPANTSFSVVAELSQDGIYRTGIAYGKTPAGGGPVSDMRVVLREQSSIEGRVVDSEGRAVPLAQYWLRELAWPHREIGNIRDPLQADLNGRFIISNVFTGPFRITAVSIDNQELRGDYQGELIEEGDVSQRAIELRIGEGGVGTVSITVRDPQLGFEPVPNAEVALYRSGRGFDFTSTNENGVAFFEQVPAGSYSASAFSKARVRGGTSASFTVVANETAAAAIELDFRGLVSGYLTDPELANARVPFQPVTVRGMGAIPYTARESTDEDGNFEVVGLTEGAFELFAYEVGTERVAFGPKNLFISRLVPEHRDIHLELERYAKLTVKVHLPDDNGGPGELAPLVETNVTAGDGSYGRAFQRNPAVFERMSQWRTFDLQVQELGGEGRRIDERGLRFPAGVFEHEHIVVLPATGTLEVLVLDGAGNPVPDANVKIGVQYGSRGKMYSVFTATDGLITIPGVPFGHVNAHVVSGLVSAAGSGELRSRSVPLRIALRLGANVTVDGLVDAESPAGTRSAATRVIVEVRSSALVDRLRLETLTDANGLFSFDGIPVGGTTLELTYYGPNDLVGAFRAVRIPDGTTGTFRAPSVTLDSTPPRVLSIDPAVNSTNVSPATSVTVTFSEQIPPEYLTATTLQLRGTGDDESLVPVDMQTTVRPDTTFIVKLTPRQPVGQPFPLRSNVLYRFFVSNAIRDLTGHQLQAAAGTSFTTVNYVEPAIVKIEPLESEALVEGQTFRIKFNKAVDLKSFDAGNGGIAVLDKLDSYKGAVIAAIPVTRYLDVTDPSTLVIAPTGVALEESSFYRLTIAGVRDLIEPPNTMRDTRRFEFFSFDRVKPAARIVSPVAEGEKLVSGVLYSATVFVSDDGTNASTDVAYVDWLNADHVSIARAKEQPFTYTFVAPPTTTGTTFTLRASATDLSFNTGEVTSFTWDVAPNEAPREIVVTPAPSSHYPGNAVQTKVAFKDEGLTVTVALELRGTKLDGTPLTQILGSQKLTRTSVSESFADATFTWTLPLTLKDGTAAIVASITDASNNTGTGEAALTVLADTTGPELVSMLPVAETRYAFGDTYTIELQARDGETGIARAVFTVAGTEVFNGTGTTAAGVTTFRHTITVPPKNADTRMAVIATAYDQRGNTVSETREVIYERVDDATLPVAAWITPVDGAALPSNESGWLTTLRIKATDDVKVTSVRFESEAMAAPVTLSAPKSGDVWEARVALTMPAAPFVIRAIVADGDPSHDVALPITIDPVAADVTISGDIAITSALVSQYENKSVLVRGGARVYMAVPLALAELMVVDGSTISNPEETRLDLTIAGHLFLDADSFVDLNEKGFVGGLRSSEGNRVINSSRNGRAPAGGATLAAGSHAGIGGSSHGATNATYGSATEPLAFGAGGSAHATSSHGGANGGGAMSIEAAKIAVAGTLRADGGSAPAWAFAGAGGSIDLRANVVVTGAAARVSANGGDESASAEVDRGGGGGRIAIRAADRLDRDGAAVEARGGRNGSAAGSQYVDGGAGTIFVNGALLVAAGEGTHAVAGTPVAGTFDTIEIGPRVLARFDAQPEGALSVHPSALVVMPDDQPTVALSSTTPAIGANVPQATNVTTTFTASSIAGIRQVRTMLKGEVVSYPRFVTSLDATSTITIPHDATTGPASLIVRVTDRAGRVAETTPATFNIVANAAPAIETMNVTPADETYAGRDVLVSATASDDVAVTSLTLTSTAGTVTPKTPGTFTVTLPPNTPSGSEVTLTLSASDGFPGRAPTTRTHKLRILADTIAPTLTVAKPLANQEFQEAAGATFVVEATADDAEVAVQRVTVTLDGVEHPLAYVSGNVWRATIAVPNVDGSAPVEKTLTFTAFDYDANASSAARTIFVKPLLDPNAPLLDWVCASPGAMAPAGYETTFRISAVPANAANGVSSVTVTVNGTAVAVTSAGTNLYEAKFTIPPGTADGTLFTIRATARSVANNESTLLGTLAAVAGTEVSTNSFIAANDSAFEGLSVIVRSGGILTITGAHRLKNLVVLNGGRVIQQHPDLLRADLLTVDRLYVACGAFIDTTALGFGRNTTAPGIGAPDFESGGGHIGRGGVAHRTGGGSFGSITRPMEAGGGGDMRYNNNPAHPANRSSGGGALRMHATAAMAIDGTIAANGRDPAHIGWGSGAGGSVWLTTPGTLAGAGTIQALGANGGNTRASGGGGAIAIEYGTVSGSLLSKLNAAGQYTGWEAEGGAGSIFTRAATATYGDLLLDNRGNNSRFTVTELPSFGRATASSVTGSTVTLSNTRWLGRWFEGHRVRVIAPDGTVRGTYVIDTVTNDAGATPVNGFAEVQTQDAVAYDGYLVHSPLGIGGNTFVAARWANGRWEYDTGALFTAFNPRSGESIIASFRKDTAAITALSTYSCEGGCPAAINGLAVRELSAGEILPNSASGENLGTLVNLGAEDNAEFFLRPDSRGRSLLVTNGVDAQITLAGAAGVQPGDTLQGVYLFDNIRLATATVTTDDLVESTNAPVLDATSSLTTGNTAAPVLDHSGFTFERGLHGPVLVAPAGAIADADAPSDVFTRTDAKPTWNRLWALFPGTRGGLSLARRPSSLGPGFSVSSLETITASGYLSFSVSKRHDVQAGLAPNDTTRNLNEPNVYAFRLAAGGTYQVWANGAYANVSGTYTANTVFRIEKNPRRLRWLVDGVPVHEVTTSIPPSLRLDVSMTTETGELHSIVLDNTTDRGGYRIAASANGAFRLPLQGAPGETFTIAANDRHRLTLTSRETTITIPATHGIQSIAVAPTEVFGGQPATGTVTLRAPAGAQGAFIELTSSDAATTVPVSITIAPNATTGTFSIATTPGRPTTDVTFSATYGGHQRTAALRVKKDETAPQIVIAKPLANAQYSETQTARIRVEATATDDLSPVSNVVATLDGVNHPMTLAGTTYVAELPVPAVSSATNVTKSISVSANDNAANTGTASVNVIVVPSEAAHALASVSVAPNPATSGSIATGTVTLGGPAPAGGATVLLSNDRPSVVTMPSEVFIAAGETEGTFAIETATVSASWTIVITGMYGATRTATLTLDACTTFDTAPQATTAPATIWFDDSVPAGATTTGTATFDSTQSASGTHALHFVTADDARTWTMSNAAALTVGPNDELLLYALVNPCDPPRQIALTWSGITTTATWGENAMTVDPFEPVAAIPAGGEWQRLRVLAKSLGVTTNTNVTGLTIRLSGGEAWFDLAGKNACTLPRASTPAPHAQQVVWYDDDPPAGASVSGSGAWNTTQSASGTRSLHIPAGSGQRDLFVTGATATMNATPGDVFYVWTLVDPCNPPRSIGVRFRSPAGFSGVAYWGEDLIPFATLRDRFRLGPVPAGGGWVRLEIPVSTLSLDGLVMQGMTMSIFDGAAWFDAPGRIPRTSLAAGKPARQSSTYTDTSGHTYGAGNAVDGETGGMYPTNRITHTVRTVQPWWEVDLGSVQPIETVQLWNRRECCSERLTNFTLFVSDEPMAGSTTAEARAQAGVRAFRFPAHPGNVTALTIRQPGRYVRVQLEGTEVLNLAEVQVWPPLDAEKVNLAAGIVQTTQSSTHDSGFADRAVNGNVNADWLAALSITHTLSELNAWWEIDLGAVQDIATIDILDRLDCCRGRLQPFRVFVSTEPFTSKVLANTLAQSGVATWYRGTATPSAYTLDIQRPGRYVRIQLLEHDFLSLTEVQIWKKVTP
jgi:hypothetical protein